MAGEKLTYRLGLKMPGSNTVFRTELFLTYEMADEWGKDQKAKYGFNYEIDDLKTIPEFAIKYANEKRKKEYPTTEEIVFALLKNVEGDSTLVNGIIQKINDINAKYPHPKEKAK
jgi:hypothetical protein